MPLATTGGVRSLNTRREEAPGLVEGERSPDGFVLLADIAGAWRAGPRAVVVACPRPVASSGGLEEGAFEDAFTFMRMTSCPAICWYSPQASLLL